MISRYKGLNLSQLKDEEVLFFVRIHGKKGIFGVYYPNTFLESFARIKEYRTISEYPNSTVHINLNSVNLNAFSKRDFEIIEKVIDVDDIIVRCRALREISNSEARELIWKSAKFFIDYFSKNGELKLIVSLIIDNYVMDVMVRIAHYFGVRTMHLIGFFIPGYIRLTERGMGVPVREVEELEVQKVYQRLVNMEKSPLAVSKYTTYKNAIKDYMSYKYRYINRYLISYKVFGNLSYEYKFAPLFKGFHTINKIFIKKYFDKIDEIKVDKKNLVYIPLHYHPEATVDYWCDKKEHADYINSLIKVIVELGQLKKKVLLKEHPNYYLRRSPIFYKKLVEFENVYMIDPYITTQDIMERVDSICVHTGSAGLEALIAGKKVYIVSENYYSFKKLPYYHEMESEEYTFLSELEKKELIREVLKSTLVI